MAAPIRVEGLDRADAADLVQALAVRGLTGRVADVDAAVELHESHEETERLLADVAEAVQAWARDRGRDALEVKVGDSASVLVGPSDLESVLRERVRRAAAHSVAPPGA